LEREEGMGISTGRRSGSLTVGNGERGRKGERETWARFRDPNAAQSGSIKK